MAEIAPARTGESAALIESFARELIERLQALYRERAPEYYAETHDGRGPCASCAIQPYTNRAKGAQRTALGFFASLSSGSPFYCHHGAPHTPGKGWHVDPATAPLCAAYWVIVGELDRRGLMSIFDQALSAVFGASRPIDDEAFDQLTATLIGMVA